MSARSIIVLALVAYVAVQANSYPSGVKGGQSNLAQQPLKSSHSTQQQWQQPSKYFGQPTYQQESVVAQQSQTSVSAPAQIQTGPAMVESAPVQQERPVETAPSAFVAAQTSQSVASAQLNEPAPVKSAPVKGQTTYQQEQRPEAAPVVAQSVASAQLGEVAPAKGPTFYQQEQRQEVATPIVAQTSQMTPFEPAPVKSAPVKGQTYQPEPRSEAASMVAPSVVQSIAPAQLKEVAPAKGQAFYQQEQRPLATKTAFEPASFKGVSTQGQTSYRQEQRLEVASASKTPQLTSVSQHYETAPVKGQPSYQQAQRLPGAPTAAASTKSTGPYKASPVKRAPFS